MKKNSTDAGFVHMAFKVQSLYALEILLKIVDDSTTKNQNHFVGLEVIEDVAHLAGNVKLVQIKDYDEKGSFTLNTEEVKKSFCNYLKVWLSMPFEDRIHFIFAFSCTIGTEKSLTDIATKLNCPKPDRSLLEKVRDNDFTDDDCKIIKQILKTYLEENKDDFHTRIDDIELSDFRIFLHAIHVKDKSPRYEKLKETLVHKVALIIQQKSTYTPEAIVHDLVQKLEERQTKDRYFDRCMGNHELEKYFYELTTKSDEVIDPDWSAMDGLEADGPDDMRNLKEKILAVFPTAGSGFLKRMNMQLSSGKAANLGFKTDQRYRALKYKVYKKSYSKLLEIQAAVDINDEKKINSALNDMVSVIETSLKEWMVDFKYPVTNKDSLEAMILDLIDSCFLKFEAED